MELTQWDRMLLPETALGAGADTADIPTSSSDHSKLLKEKVQTILWVTAIFTIQMSLYVCIRVAIFET